MFSARVSLDSIWGTFHKCGYGEIPTSKIKQIKMQYGKLYTDNVLTGIANLCLFAQKRIVPFNRSIIPNFIDFILQSRYNVLVK